MSLRPLRVLHLLLALALLFWPRLGIASDNLVLAGQVVDLEGKPVQGAELFAYQTPQVRRPADFISRGTGSDGHYRIELPAGKYWLVARQRAGARFGPLVTGGRHSGEAREVEGEAGEEISLDFTVADIREMAAQTPRGESDFQSVEGRILDRHGKPVAGAYAFARGEGGDEGVPEFVSAYSGATGSYNLQLPPGSYRIGAAREFPPGNGVVYAPLVVGEAAAVSKDLAIPGAAEKELGSLHDDREND